MKLSFLVLGAIILVGGLLTFFIGFLGIGEYQTFAGQLSRFLFGQAETQYRSFVLTSLVGLVLAPIGLVLILYGSLAKSSRNTVGDR